MVMMESTEKEGNEKLLVNHIYAAEKANNYSTSALDLKTLR
jgi:hypothetical protein